jgi:membrane-bound serine protease (ClpP class)
MINFLDPNIIYLGLIVSLWAILTIVYTPGTIIGELISGVFAIFTLIGLSQMPTNWVAVLVIVLGVSSFLALPFVSLKWARFADLGLILQLLGGFLLFNNGVAVSPATIIVTVLIAWAYHRLILLPALKHHHHLSTLPETTLVGKRGRVTRDIHSVGTVYVDGESWTARSAEHIKVDTEIVVTQKVGLELRVEKAKRDDNQK